MKKSALILPMRRILCLISAAIFVISAFPLAARSKELTEMTVAVFGDSISAAGIWEDWFYGHTGVKVINMGVGGDNTEKAKSRLDDVLALGADAVFIQFGSNDSAIDMEKYVPIDAFKANLVAFAEAFANAGTRVIFITPPPIVDEAYLTRHDEAPFIPYGGPNGLVSLYAEAVREVALQTHSYTADVNAMFNSYEDYTVYFSDGLHPNNSGYSKYTLTCIESWRLMWIGDINADSSVDSKDYVLAKRAVLGSYVLTSAQLERADINRNGKADAVDYQILKRVVLGTYSIK